jgi:hypothetical protein
MGLPRGSLLELDLELELELELELIQTQMAQKPMLRAEVYARVLEPSQRSHLLSFMKVQSVHELYS